MTRRLPYSALKDATDQVRVNAVILELFERNPDGFIERFYNQARQEASLKDGFQATLDHLRDVLSENIKFLPALTKNKADDRQDLFKQRQLLRAVRDMMVEDGMNGLRPVEKYKNTVAWGMQGVNSDLSENPLPRPVSGFAIPLATLFSVVQAKSQETLIPADEAAAARMPSSPLGRGQQR